MIGQYTRGNLFQDLDIQPGTTADYDALAPLHYRAGRPATVIDVWRAVLRTPTMAGRFAQLRRERTLLGVLIVSMPVLNCRARRFAWPELFKDADRPTRTKRINGHVRTISRVIIDPRVRGIGIAPRLVRHALAHASTRYTEAMATMGDACPFFERAGMQRVEYPPAPDDARLLKKFACIGVNVHDLLSAPACGARLDGLAGEVRNALLRAAETWRLASGVRKRKLAHLADEPTRVLAIAARHLAFRPVYYAYDDVQAGSDEGRSGSSRTQVRPGG